MRMLIIDDSSTMRNLLGMIAVELGAEAEKAEDGEAALACVEKGPAFDVALVDWDMPRMNGLEFVKRIRSSPTHQAMKLMMVTSHHAVVMRRLISSVLESDPELEVAGIAPNGKLALARIPQVNPDVVTLDVE